MNHDVGKTIRDQKLAADKKRAEFSNLNEVYFEYLFYEELEDWYHYITEKYPKFSKLEKLGESTENRSIYGMTIGGDIEDKSRKVLQLKSKFLVSFRTFSSSAEFMPVNGFQPPPVDILSINY